MKKSHLNHLCTHCVALEMSESIILTEGQKHNKDLASQIWHQCEIFCDCDNSVQIIIVHIKDNITLKYLLSTPNILLDNIYYLVCIYWMFDQWTSSSQNIWIKVLLTPQPSAKPLEEVTPWVSCHPLIILIRSVHKSRNIFVKKVLF